VKKEKVMSNYHIRDIMYERNSSIVKTVNVVFHIPIPTGNNAVGIAWRTALIAHLGGASAIKSVLLEVVGTQEEIDMKAGAILEKSCTVRLPSRNLTDAQRLAEVVSAFTAEKNMELTTKQIQLKYFGKVGDVV